MKPGHLEAVLKEAGKVINPIIRSQGTYRLLNEARIFRGSIEKKGHLESVLNEARTIRDTIERSRDSYKPY
jgi:hypothetical protein